MHIPNGFGRTILWLGVIALAPLWCGCARLAPKGFASDPAAAGLLGDDAARQAALRALFPPLEKLHLSGEIVARKGRLSPALPFNFSLFVDLSTAGDQPLRLRGNKAGKTIFDLLVRDTFMTVILYQPFVDTQLAFEGVIPPEGSPFAARFGVEPGDLVPVIALGQTLANGEFAAEEPGGRRLIPRAAATKNGRGLSRVTLDRRSGLPARARWSDGEGGWDVRYKAWDWFRDKAGDSAAAHLMPRELEINRLGGGPRMSVAISGYQFSGGIPRLMFAVPASSRTRPLSDLGRLLEAL